MDFHPFEDQKTISKFIAEAPTPEYNVVESVPGVREHVLLSQIVLTGLFLSYSRVRVETALQ